MGFLKTMFKEVRNQGEALVMEQLGQQGGTKSSSNPPTRWEKAVVSLNGIVSQVSQIDPDGVDVICFGGSGEPEVFRNIKNTDGLDSMVSSKQPEGACQMGAALDLALQEAYTRGFDERPCSILVLTAGRPDDSDTLDKAIADAATKMSELDTKESPLSITFVQIGDDEEATQYMKHLDEDLTKESSAGKTVDIVDTIKDEDIKSAMKEFKKGGGKGGAIIGAFAGAALGVGGMYIANKINAKKRTKGWNGTWKVTSNGEEKYILTIADDMNGNLTLSGYPDEVTANGTYANNEEDGYVIQYTEPSASEAMYGTVEDEHNVSWSNGTRWEEVPPKGQDWKVLAAAGAAGATAGGASGFLMSKKFFNKASRHVKSDYVVILDRSSMMAVPDSGK
jgi:hypothetical protein